ncbi:hypothetical protein FG361_09060 [Listeria monocytogenes]|nr:hypothetical protein [Listeria monocytogenes]EAW7325198.1 hypothetical protein [Listeria monocytogenes]
MMTDLPHFVQNELTGFTRIHNDNARVIASLYYAMQERKQGVPFSKAIINWCSHEDNLYSAVKFLMEGEGEA